MKYVSTIVFSAQDPADAAEKAQRMSQEVGATVISTSLYVPPKVSK